jgi:predicted nuclease of predicted toxin-antitoxin system
MRETAPGSSDVSVLGLAHAENRLLLTFDKDFGDLVFHRGLAASAGIILFRIAQPSADILARRVAAILDSRADWHGQYSVVEEHAIRMRPLP